VSRWNVRSLTDNEARVIAALLASELESERTRLRRIGVPRSTYHSARRRAYEEGWLRDRYIPDPSRFDWPVATIAVARPYIDRGQALESNWTDIPGNVVAWFSPQVAFGVFFHRSAEDASSATQQWEKLQLASRIFSVSLSVAEPSVPAYFDFEGLWGHLADEAGARSYPNGIGGREPGELANSGPTDHQRWAAGELVRRPFVVGASGRASPLSSPLGLPFSQRRLLASGWVRYRVLLDPLKVPPFRGRTANDVVFVTGTLQPSATPQQLFQVLTRECRVFPFLFATDGHKLLLGALGGKGEPAIEGAAVTRRPVMPSLQESLGGIELFSDSAERFRTLVDHRYDRLFPAKT
jgi:hypothetical protein